MVCHHHQVKVRFRVFHPRTFPNVANHHQGIDSSFKDLLIAKRIYPNMGSKRKLEKPTETKEKKSKKSSSNAEHESFKEKSVSFDHRYIVSPMVGASELPFRLLCRKYGAQLVYTPMMIAEQFATSKEYRAQEFQTCSFDRPLVCHFAANDPKCFAKAAKKAEPYCDAIDLNLGCPQRTAHVGHFGSYLLDPKDRELVVNIIKAGVEAVDIPIFVKIRLLDTFEDTMQLCRQLYDAGASLIAVHARYRATFHRKGPGARNGAALLDQVQKLKETFPDNILITNGNTITYEDVAENLRSTQADGIMSAEGILDNPGKFIARFVVDVATAPLPILLL
jgi:tRNA-dihydrouridine synthase 1